MSHIPQDGHALHSFTDHERDMFWSRVGFSPGDDSCWLWRGARGGRGYGQVGLWRSGKWKTVRASRVSYAINNGNGPGQMHVCHRCDNPSCVRPDHLFLGTVQDNHDDMVAKNRVPVGTRCKHAKLDEDKVADLRARIASGVMIKDVARDMGVSAATVSKANSRGLWKHVQ